MDALTNQVPNTAGGFALRYFHVLVLVFVSAGGLAAGLIYLLPAFGSPATFSLPGAFWLSSGCLALSSLMQHRSIQAVRWERQRKFRRRLLLALVAGIGFVAVQSYGLWCLFQYQPRTTQAASTGPEAFVFVLTLLHGMHVTIALMFLTYVFLKSLTYRYDHEYYWGVTFCSLFWHALGIVWLGILAVFLIAI